MGAQDSKNCPGRELGKPFCLAGIGEYIKYYYYDQNQMFTGAQREKKTI